mmetsp:Transcript_46910/g.130648  ORF Transcript_46910/g.130648 Transcript_46910/m.130648 type:complete len:409 (+) Transcript_46910:147-1373(+)|eukprot:CAMPEP_0117525854 /NCGR_PEP_ID=MMETSP0784-20121206/35986_1 /TAXON_ID=39447 /ORGANISM="" /LENGTH=408 /DNA_ID=CAMNT_0005322067 /DNA_START=142 /DNA_END=1368 /DNA_ORIENTATION=+
MTMSDKKAFATMLAKKPRTAIKYEFWPSSLRRAGHTTVEIDPSEPLYQHLQEIPKHAVYDAHMARMQRLPCKLLPTSKFRNGANRWWCPVHQGSYGKKAQVQAAGSGGPKCCDQAEDLVDFVCTSDVPEFCLVSPGQANNPSEYCELGVWIGLAPAMDTWSTRPYFYSGIHVHARKVHSGPKVVDKNFPAIRIKDKTGRFPRIPAAGIVVTPPAALEYLYYMENNCPVNSGLGLRIHEGQTLPRSPVELTEIVRCKHCETLHEDIGDFFGENLHKKHLCGTCGRDIFGAPSIGNPMQAFAREWKREVVGVNIDPDNAEVHLESSKHSFMIWPSTPALFWSRDAPEIWGVHVHAFDAKGDRVIDDTFGRVYIDGVKLERSKLFVDMLCNSVWMEDQAEQNEVAQELEDD